MENRQVLLQAIQNVESGGDPNAVSEAGALGLMQLNPSSFPEFTPEELRDPYINFILGSQYLNELVDRYGNVEDAVSAYHAGPGNFDKWVDAGRPVEGFEAFGERSLAYLPKVQEQYAKLQAPKTEGDVPAQSDDLQSQINMEYYRPDNMVENHPDLINYARQYYNDKSSSDEEIRDRIVFTMRNFESFTPGTGYYLYDLSNASPDQRRGFGHMLQYWANAPDMIDYLSEGEYGDAFEAFATNFLRGVADPANLLAVGAGAIAGRVGRTALQKSLNAMGVL